MSIIGWLILGLVAGFIASKVMNRSGQGLMLDIGLGAVGVPLLSLFGAAPVSGLNLHSMFVAVVGALVVLFAYHAIVGRRRTA